MCFKRGRTPMNIAVFGLGNIRLSVASHISKFYPIKGYDIKDAAVINALSKRVRASTKLEKANFVIAVNTYCHNNNPDMSAVDSCCEKIAKLTSNALVCFESTLAVGTARKFAEKYNLRVVAVCPHRWWQHDQENQGVEPCPQKQCVECGISETRLLNEI